MIKLGTGRIGDALLVSRVPWISYTWGPYGLGMNVLLAPGENPPRGRYTEDGIRTSVEYCEKYGRAAHRRTGHHLARQPDRAYPAPRASDRAGPQKRTRAGHPVCAFRLDLQSGHRGRADGHQRAAERLFARRARAPDGHGRPHQIARRVKYPERAPPGGEKVIDFVNSRASHGVMPNFHGQAIAQVAYEMGFRKAAAPIIGPTNASREMVRRFLAEKGYRAIMGDGGYYAFINVRSGCRPPGWPIVL